MKNVDFLKIELLKVYLNDSNVSNLEKRKKVQNQSTLLLGSQHAYLSKIQQTIMFFFARLLEQNCIKKKKNSGLDVSLILVPI